MLKKLSKVIPAAHWATQHISTATPHSIDTKIKASSVPNDLSITVRTYSRSKTVNIASPAKLPTTASSTGAFVVFGGSGTRLVGLGVVMMAVKSRGLRCNIFGQYSPKISKSVA